MIKYLILSLLLAALIGFLRWRKSRTTNPFLGWWSKFSFPTLSVNWNWIGYGITTVAAVVAVVAMYYLVWPLVVSTTQGLGVAWKDFFALLAMGLLLYGTLYLLGAFFRLIGGFPWKTASVLALVLAVVFLSPQGWWKSLPDRGEQLVADISAALITTQRVKMAVPSCREQDEPLMEIREKLRLPSNCHLNITAVQNTVTLVSATEEETLDIEPKKLVMWPEGFEATFIQPKDAAAPAQVLMALCHKSRPLRQNGRCTTQRLGRQAAN